MAYKKAEKFSYSFDLSGTDRPTIVSLPIATGTVIERGERVALSAGFIVAAADTALSIGFSADPHDGSSDGQKGVMIRVYASPGAVMECIPAELIVADASSTTNSFLAAAELGSLANDVLIGGHLKMVSSTNLTDGEVIAITDSVTSTGEVVTAGGEVFAVADTAIVFPPVGSVVVGMDSDGTNLELEEAGTELRVVAVDFVSEKVYVMNIGHQFATVND